MNHLKRFFSVALSVCCCLTMLCGCQHTESPLDVALILKTSVETAEFWEQILDGMEDAAKEFKVSLRVDGTSAETEIDEQISVMEDVIASKPDVIILVAADYDRLVPAVESAADAGIPVITMDSDVNTDARLCCVASDNFEIGRSMGDEMIRRISEGYVAILSHSSVSTSGIDRASGAKAALDESTLDVTGIYNCDNDVAVAKAIVSTLLESDQPPSGIICTNEVCNLAVAELLVEQDRVGDVIVVGCDNSQQQIQYLEQNVIQAIVIQQPFTMGYEAVRQAVKAVAGEEVPAFFPIPGVNITQENMYEIENQKLLFPF